MSRIAKAFERLNSDNQKALVAFITAGDPDIPTTQDIFSAVEEGGADIIELGVPFSDPLADGPVIQASAQRALKSGTTLKKIIGLVSDIRKKSELPIVLMTSYNPVWAYDPEQFVQDAKNAGVDGMIVPDLPPEEAGEFEADCQSNGIDLIYLVAPTSTPERVSWIGGKSRGFIYYVSLTGTTGVRSGLAEGVKAKVAAIKNATPLPVLIGFGISNSDNAREAADISDGVIVGSAIVRLIEEAGSNEERLIRVREFVSQIKQAIT